MKLITTKSIFIILIIGFLSVKSFAQEGYVPTTEKLKPVDTVIVLTLK